MNVTFPKETTAIKGKNIVVYMWKNTDISLLDFLALDQSIIQDITTHQKKKKSSFQQYFLWRTYKNLYVYIDRETNLEQQVNFLGKHFPKLPDSLTLIATDIETKNFLLEVCELSRYTFQTYKTKKKKRTTEVVATSAEQKKLKDTLTKLEHICLARDLGETPASDLTPKTFADIVKKTKFSRVKVTVLTYADIKKQGLGLIEAVGKGSENKPQMVILEHIVDPKKPVFGIVGKGVTFDTGGNQLKPENYMYDMKWDMWGAAVTYALMKEIDRKKVKKNIVACLCLAENVVSSNAYKPSDILTGYTGKTVEVIHTDAEWRLVLADGMSYLGKNYTTNKMMTIATLTGACVVALGYRHAGVMGTDTKMIRTLTEYSSTHTEKYVELPFCEYMLEKTKSKIADYNNLDRNVHAGSSMWAAFLANFLENDELYTHIDIAGVYINEADAYGKVPKWMTGFWVESLSDILTS